MMIMISKSFFGCSQETALSILPVHDFPDLLDIVKTQILVVDVVGMLPNVDR
jgi:hypothetical protein